MKKKIIVAICAVLLLMTGCTKTLVDGDKNRVINEETGQNLTSNILCRPEDENLVNLYKKYDKYLDVSFEDLPSCKDMKIYDKNNYNGLWVQLFVRPLAWIIIALGTLVGNYGLSVMLIGLFIR